MSLMLAAGHEPFSIYQRSTAALIVALLWALTLFFAVSLETVTRGTMIAAMIPRIVTTASNSMSEKPDRFVLMVFMFTPIQTPQRRSQCNSLSFDLERDYAFVYLKVGQIWVVAGKLLNFSRIQRSLMGMAYNESSGCIDCVGRAINRAHGHTAGE